MLCGPGYTSKAKQGEPMGCMVDEKEECSAGFACEHTTAMSEARWQCLRREVLLDKPTPRKGEKFVVVRQASFGMLNSVRGGMTAGLLLAALTHRRLLFDWPDVTRNFGATAPARLAPSRQPNAGEWWLAANWTSSWSESGMERRDAKGALLEEVKLERVRDWDSARFVEVQSGATSLPLSPGAVACAARLFGSIRCAKNVRCIQGVAYRVLLSEPTPLLAASLERTLPALPHSTTVVGLHLRSWPKAMEGDDNPPRKVPINDWALSFFDCAELALNEIEGDKVIYFATDNPAFKANATDRLAKFGRVVSTQNEVTHTRTAGKRGAIARTTNGADSAVLDWFALADKSRVFVGTRASTFSDAVIDRGCLGSLDHFWQLGSSGDCGRSTCAAALPLAPG